MTTLDTRPYCSHCGWQVGTPGDPDAGPYPDLKKDRICDSCGSDLALSGFNDSAGDLPPDNPPSPPNASATEGEVTFTWTTSDISFPEGYDFGYSLGGAAPIVTPQAISPQVVTAAPGVEVCGALEGYRGGVGSGYSAENCAIASNPAVTAPPETSNKAALIEWLHGQGVHGVQALTKDELWSLITDLLD